MNYVGKPRTDGPSRPGKVKEGGVGGADRKSEEDGMERGTRRGPRGKVGKRPWYGGIILSYAVKSGWRVRRERERERVRQGERNDHSY